MRVTNKMMTNTYNRFLNQNMASIQKVEQQLITGKLYTRPSNNPYATTRVMGYETEIRRYEQYEKNIRDVESNMSLSDNALSQVNTMFKRIRELAIQAENGTMDNDQREVVANEIDEILGSIVSSFNSSLDNQYLFGGTVTDTPPFEIEITATGDKRVVYHGNGDAQKVEVSPSIFVDKMITGDRFLTEVNGRNLFQGIIELSDAMRSGNTDLINELTADLIEFENIVLDARGVAGATERRMQMSGEKVTQEIESMTDQLSKHGDTDYALKMIEYKSLNAMYEASLQISANILRPTLMEFLK